MPTRSVNGQLEIDVSHPWDRPEPIRQPEYNPDCVPTEEEIIEMLEQILESDPHILACLITEYDPSNFFDEGSVRLANLQGSS